MPSIQFTLNWQFYNDFKARAFEKRFNLNATDVIKVALVTLSSNAIDAAMSGALYSAITDELAPAFGYATGGATVVSPVIIGGGALTSAQFQCTSVSWTPVGGSLIAAAAVIYDATSGDLIAFCLLSLLEGVPDELTVPEGVTFELAIPVVFTMS